MIGADLSELGEAETVAAARSLVRKRLVAENDELRLIAHFAQMQGADSLPDPGNRLPVRGERTVRLGGVGTPEVAEFAPKTFGLETRMSPGKAQSRFAAVLDLQYRLPHLWREVCAYRVQGWLACMIARRTRELPLALVHTVDVRIDGRMSGISWDRCRDIVDAETIKADPDRAERIAQEALAARFVRVGQSNDESVKTIYTRMAKADAIWFDATVERLAVILSTAENPIAGVNPRGASTKDEWRSVAQGVLANPLLAARILLDHEQPDLLSEAAGAEEHEAVEPAEADEPAEAKRRALRRLLRSLDLQKLLPPVDLYVHVARDAITGRGGQSGVGRVEGLGPAVLGEVRDWLGSGCRVRVRPVIDLADVGPVDQYEVPARMREAVHLIAPASMFPYSGNRSRRKDVDHAIAYRRRSSGDPPGLRQTGLHNLGPLVEGEHRYRTFGPIRLRQPEPGVRVWRTRFGTVLVENDSGTHDLGNGSFARSVWEATAALSPALNWYRSVMVVNGERSAAEESVERAVVTLGA